MGTIRKSQLVSILINKKNELLDISKKEMSNFINGTTRESCGSGSEDGDVSVSLHAEDVSIGAGKIRHAMLVQIDNALLKLAEGEYGICDECGEEIDVRRLNALPFALLCRDCQEERETLEQTDRSRNSF